MRDDEPATVNAPLHNRLFDVNVDEPSPVLRHHQEALKAKANLPVVAPAVAAPVINFTFSNDVMERLNQFIHPPAAPALAPAAPALAPAAPAPAYTPTDTAGQYNLLCPTLVQAGQVPGHDMPIADLRVTFNLGDGIAKKLLDNSYRHARIWVKLQHSAMELRGGAPVKYRTISHLIVSRVVFFCSQ
jgi:hypothetical protein